MEQENKTCPAEGQVTNAYEEEKETIEESTKERIELGLRIRAILDDYGYDLVAVDVAGTPTVRFTKRLS